MASRRCHLDWGLAGVTTAAKRGDGVVIVDTLSFSTTVATALSRGMRILPCSSPAEIEAAQALFPEAEVAVPRNDVPARGRLSLSPVSFLADDLDPVPSTVIVWSPNGATCCRAAREHGATEVLIGTIINAAAIGRALSAGTDSDITVVACGERRHHAFEDPHGFRVALEDELGAGAVIASLDESFVLSVEAHVALDRFVDSRSELDHLLQECESGRELLDRRFESDVFHAGRHNTYDVVPRLASDGRIVNGAH